MFALLLSFPLLCLQAGGPDLPEALASEPAVTEAWTLAQDTSKDAAARAVATDMVLRRLQTLPAEQQLPFLLEAHGAGVLTADLVPIYRQLDKDWELLETRLIESLLQLENPDLVHGALRCAGSLKSSDIPLIESVAALLERSGFGSDARRALDELTGQSFPNLTEFQSWWDSSKELGREVWLERAVAAGKEREIRDWRSWLSDSPGHVVILNGLSHDLPEVRMLALASLKVFDFDAADAGTKTQIANDFRDALAAESFLEQRKALLELVPRLLTGHEALRPLLSALANGHSTERLSAARLLKQIQPREVALEGVGTSLDNVYPADSEGPIASVQVRIALWASLSFLARDGGVADDPKMPQRLELALEVETNQDVRAQIHSAIGTLAGESFLPVLEAIVVDLDAPASDREESLVAMTTISKRIAKSETVQKLLPQLLADPEAQVRRQAIESLGQLDVPDGALMLAARLPLESEAFLQKRMLALLGSKPSPAVLEALLGFKPATELLDPYGTALIAQIANDFATFTRVLDYFEANQQKEMAFRVVLNFKLKEPPKEQGDQLNARYARAVSEFLLDKGANNGNSAYAADAAARLREMMVAEPTSWQWPFYLVSLQLDRGEIAEAITVMNQLFDYPDFAVHTKWELGLRTLHSAAAVKMLNEGVLLLNRFTAGYESEMPEAFRTWYKQVHGAYKDATPSPVPFEKPEEQVEEAPTPETPENPVAENPDQVPSAGDGDQETPKMAIGNTQL